ncbi:MAG: hypothetical protein MRZ75_04820 [Roseburia sp.]|uniref:hypothetical protein n=1 Tax=Roseburia sp. 831b TaxID=1261635 RepID=UPI000952E0EF|nr:hypothetical protein [Roseburia sp. 831b]MCI5918643.1 hypothetical protein [Roseburia sp.]WVK73931.1 hypothetical protein BIV16_05275 [Roseburia sp. 831b]
MKKTVVICIFCVLILGGILFAGYQIQNEKDEKFYQTKDAVQNEEAKKQEEKMTESMQIQEPYQYIMFERDGYLVVYEKDGKTVYFESHIPYDVLSKEQQEEVCSGKKFSSIEAVYDFLENYSS